MRNHQAKNAKFDYSKNGHLTRFIDRLGEAEIELHEYQTVQPGFPDLPSRHIPGTDDLSTLHERAEIARLDESIALEGLSQAEKKHLLHELQVHQIDHRMQNDERRRVQLELEANSTLCSLPGVRVTASIQNQIQPSIDPEDEDRFYLYEQAAIQSESSHIWEIEM